MAQPTSRPSTSARRRRLRDVLAAALLRSMADTLPSRAARAWSAEPLLGTFSGSTLRRTPGVAIFVSPEGEIDRSALLRFIAAERALPERVVLVRHRVALVPHVPLARQARVTLLAQGVQMAAIRFGFDDTPDLPRALAASPRLGLPAQAVRYYVTPERLEAVMGSRMPRWRQRLFAWMLRMSVPAAEHLHLPAGLTVQLAQG